MKTFKTSDGVIEYNQARIEDLICHPNPISLQNPILIEWVEADNQGQGQGTKLMDEFIKDMKNKKVDLVYLFAQIEEDDSICEEEAMKKLQKLVLFYSKFGFEKCSRPEHSSDQVDMYLQLRDL